MQKQQKDQVLLEIRQLSRDIRELTAANGKKLDEVHAEVGRVGLTLKALKDSVRAVETAVRARPQWLLILLVGVLLGASLILHVARL